MNQSIQVRVNGNIYRLSIDTRTTLLDLLREHLGLTGSKKGCDHGQCGACTLLSGDNRSLHCHTSIRYGRCIHCFECHGDSAKPKAWLDVRLARLLVQGGETGPAAAYPVRGGKRRASEMYGLIRK